jgi:hypothetical protein
MARDSQEGIGEARHFTALAGRLRVVRDICNEARDAPPGRGAGGSGGRRVLEHLVETVLELQFLLLQVLHLAVGAGHDVRFDVLDPLIQLVVLIEQAGKGLVVGLETGDQSRYSGNMATPVLWMSR